MGTYGSSENIAEHPIHRARLTGLEKWRSIKISSQEKLFRLQKWIASASIAWACRLSFSAKEIAYIAPKISPRPHPANSLALFCFWILCFLLCSTTWHTIIVCYCYLYVKARSVSRNSVMCHKTGAYMSCRVYFLSDVGTFLCVEGLL